MTDEEIEPTKRKLPEFIVIDDNYWKEPNRPGEEFLRHSKIRQTPPATPGKMIRLRLIALLIGLFILIGTLSALILSAAITLLSALMLFRVPIINNLRDLYWSWTKSASALTLGLLVIPFSLYIGLTIIIAYFSRTGDNWQRFYFARMLYPHVKDYMGNMQ